MPSYLSPGVYVEEVPSGSAPIAGVGTSIAAFIGTINPSAYQSDATTTQTVGSSAAPVAIGTGEGGNKKSYIFADLYPISGSNYGFFADGEAAAVESVTNNDADKTVTVKFDASVASGAAITGFYDTEVSAASTSTYAAESEIKLCTNFTEFKKYFGDFMDPTGDTAGQNTLAHSVYGFFRNGGTRCYIVWISGQDKIAGVLEDFEAIDEITLVLAPGSLELRDDISSHCSKMGDRFAILDSQEEQDLSSTSLVADLKPFNSDYAALYFPWIEVYDPNSDSNIFVPPSGAIAGVYARVDSQRGVHKAPANESILGALSLKYAISKAKQDGLNPDGINCIRQLNGNIRIWGARTLGGNANGEFKYINIRRHFNYLKESIDEGTQWTVFEPNTSELWAKIRRNVSAFLMIEWSNGALFGSTPEQAFYVKCDAETNPPEIRDAGQVVTEIGLAVVKPAEFVIFRISQWSGN
ncbi:phage tail sheath protein [[Leptolyngbya] sp. PCC 7376]|uniref:phage tail sheath subtilisin-like domain-containing protein n=1 Tax=[Leptolyngbya] sp. PCC 7376 TaxID=111781 RepID=UPI00029F2AE3|nr:phage tail sheath subtilisin-like domain-containing protein [[Leptolyngbya] sp. PCC 7376]AFY37034.1 phage tail sheath protein [[Leptolyngbya] sp. PCC 7376]